MPADWLYAVTVFAMAYDQSHSATVVGILTLARLLPPAVSALFASALSEKYNQKAILLALNLGRAACVPGLLVVHGSVFVPVAFLMMLIMGIMAGLYRPVLNASLPAVIPPRNLLEANSVMSQIDMMSYGVGPGLSGLFVLAGRNDLALLLTAVLFLLAPALLLRVHLPAIHSADASDEHEPVGVFVGVRFLVQHHAGVPAAFVVTIAVMSLLSGGYWSIAGALSVESLHLGTQGMGFLSAAYGAGGVMAGLVVGSIALSHGLTRVFIAAIAISSIAAALFGLSQPGTLPFLWNAVMGATDIFSVVCVITVLQVATPGRLMGRVFGAYESILILSMASGSVVVGPLIDVVGPRLGTVIFAGAAVLALLCCLPWLLKLERVLGLRLFLHKVPMLSALSGGALEDLSGHLSLERFPPGTTVVREGEEGDSLYLIKGGQVEIRQRGSGAEERVLYERGPGDYFGEIALLRAVPRTATVTTVDHVELYRLSYSDYLDVIEHSPELSDALEQRLERYTSPWTRAVLRR